MREQASGQASGQAIVQPMVQVMAQVMAQVQRLVNAIKINALFLKIRQNVSGRLEE